MNTRILTLTMLVSLAAAIFFIQLSTIAYIIITLVALYILMFHDLLKKQPETHRVKIALHDGNIYTVEFTKFDWIGRTDPTIYRLHDTFGDNEDCTMAYITVQGSLITSYDTFDTAPLSPPMLSKLDDDELEMYERGLL